MNVTGGVPENSVLGLLLFLLFLNDLPEAVINIDSYGYADDFEASTLSQNNLNQATENIDKWLEENKMKPNTKNLHVLNIEGDLNAK